MDSHAAWGQLLQLLRVETAGVLGGAAAIVLYRLLTGKIRLTALLDDGNGRFSAWRVQFLVTTLLVAGLYLLGRTILGTPVRITLVALLAGSNLLYLLQKFRHSADQGDFDGR